MEALGTSRVNVDCGENGRRTRVGRFGAQPSGAAPCPKQAVNYRDDGRTVAFRCCSDVCAFDISSAVGALPDDSIASKQSNK